MFYDFMDYTFDIIPDAPQLDPTFFETMDWTDPQSLPNAEGTQILYPGLFDPPIYFPVDQEFLNLDFILDLLNPMNADHLNFILDPLNYYFEPRPYEIMWNPDNFNGIGTPVQDAEYWNPQTEQNSCAVMAQISIYESLTGYELPEEIVCEIAEEIGWYDDETGTTMADTGKILEVLGVPVDRSYYCSLGDIASALANGDEVIVGLDGSEIWTPYRDVSTNLPLEQNNAGHAVWVIGLDIEPDGRVVVILNDSGSPDGAGMAVDAADFMNAWEDYDCFMAVAETSSMAAT
jgi:hypothetical protein